MMERRDRVSAASVMDCDVPRSYRVPWVLEELQLWYGVFGTTLEQNLKDPLEIPFAVKGLREPACCCIFGTELLLTAGLQPSCSIFWKFIPGQSRQVWRQVAVTASNTWWFWIAWCHLSHTVAYRELSGTEVRAEEEDLSWQLDKRVQNMASLLWANLAVVVALNA